MLHFKENFVFIFFFFLRSIPIVYSDGQMKYSQCQMYSRNYTEIITFLHSIDTALLSDTGDLFFEPVDYSARYYEIVDCANGWNYDRSMFPNTVVMEVWIFVLIPLFFIYINLVNIILVEFSL